MLDFISKFKGDFLVNRDLKVYSYEDLEKSIIEISNDYSKIKPGTKVIIRSDYSFKSISIFLYLAKLGCNICPITSENDAELNEKLLLFKGDYLIDSKLNYKLVFLENNKIKNDISDLNASITLFSSGTSGIPKMMVQNLKSIFESHDVPKNQKQLRILLFLLFDHVGGLNTLISSIKKGMCVAITSSRNPEDICNFISEANINVLPTTPTFLNMLLLSDAFIPEKFNSIKLITYGTEKMPPGTLKKINILLPRVKLLQTFGTSETGIVKTISKSSDSLFFKIIDTDYKVVNNELFLKTKTQIKNYEGINSDSFTQDGWFKTGDIVEVDDDGFIKVISRINNIINVGGLKVFPNEIEQLILELDFVIDATVYGEPNAFVGNIICLKVIVERKIDVLIAKKQIKLFCRTRLDKYKIPQKIIVTNIVTSTLRFKKSLE
jgi:acyl-coenzyme A synthetase/AMP-(fatty) acid ligase